MSDRTGIEQVITAAVTQALERHLPGLREEIVRTVLEQVRPQMSSSASAGAPTESGAGELLKSISQIQAGNTQKEILRSLLDSTSPYSGRAALFVVKGGSATGWQGRGFEHNDGIKDFALDSTGGVAYESLHSRITARGRASEMDPEFFSRFGSVEDDRVLVLPLLLKDKVAALVYADPGASGVLDSTAIEVLVKATSAWLEVASLRKQAQKDGPTESAEADVPAVQTVSSFSDPFASHAPTHVAVAAPAAAPLSMAAAAPASGAPPQMSAEDAETHRKAQRFARLLMDEIKLYNQVKVTEGRKNRDLYDRLKDDIEKSRATYMKRYGSTAAASADYFSHEVVRSLAEDDVSLMGANFRG
ncbi:MAG TPA: hypothetical protein VKV30_14890 [Candidatus Angelobacter sp.]|nr:hypothetical protein [Candidatus Angelobacter sp.]